MNKANTAEWQSDDMMISDEADAIAHDDSHTAINEADPEGRRRELVAKRRRLEDRLEVRRLQSEFGEAFDWDDEL